MKKLILGIVFAVAGTFATQAQEISFEKDIHDFGTFEQHGNGLYEFKFTNTGDAPLIISNSKAEATKVIRIKGKTLAAEGEQTTPVKKTIGNSPVAKPTK